MTERRWERGRAFRTRLLAGEPVLGTFLSTGNALNAEAASRAGFDWALVDLEHGFANEATLVGELMAIELGGAAALVRVESGAPLRIGRVLDQGASGVMVPRIRSAQEAAAAASAMAYPPAGARGVALSVRGAEYGGASAGEVGLIDDGITTIIQIENEEALASVAEIAAVPGVDVLFVGPNDLTHGMGIPGRFDDPRYLEALARVADATRAAGKAAGVMLRNPDEVRPHLDLGYTFLALSTDLSLLADAERTALAAMRAVVDS
jgi:2-dehydro-3-deoxyglucarate aldolase/4-hydroxy-2-oxoheptanedioate aldolase